MNSYMQYSKINESHLSIYVTKADNGRGDSLCVICCRAEAQPTNQEADVSPETMMPLERVGSYSWGTHFSVISLIVAGSPLIFRVCVGLTYLMHSGHNI